MAYRSGKRPNEILGMTAKTLNDEDIRKLAVGYAATLLALAALSRPGFVLAAPEDALSASAATVTVTVTRGVEQRSFDTPASVDVIDGAALREAQLKANLSETLARVPGIVALNRQNYAQDLQVSSRGFGARASFGVRGIRLYADGVPASGPDGQGQVSHFDLASAARVEVLRGPFSVLYGNSSGGVISLTTEDPGLRPAADVDAAWGSDGVRRQGLKLGGTHETLQYLISASHFSTDGARDHSAATRNGFNGKLRWQASPGSRLTLVLNSLRMPDAQDPLGLTRAEWQANPRQATPVALAYNTRKSVNQDQVGLVWDYRLTHADGVQITPYAGERGAVQFQAIPASAQGAPSHPGGVIDLHRRYQGIDARWIRRGRLLDRALTLTAGVAVEELDEQRRGYQNFIGSGASQLLGVQGALRRDEANTVRTSDQYVQIDWALAERWRLMAGVRHSGVSFRSRDRYITTGNGDDSGAVRHEASTPALGLVFHASEAVNLYAAWGQGFETPTFNELAYRPGGATGLNFSLQPARSRQFEAGLKAQWLPDWRAQAAVFHARTRDEIAVQSNTGGRSVFQNVGRTTRVGAEVSLAGRLAPGWSTLLALSSLRATFDDAFSAGTTPVAPGNRLPGIPRGNAYAELAWEHALWGLRSALEWRATGRLFVNDTNTDSAAGQGTASLRLSLRQQSGGWVLNEFLRVDNLGRRMYAGSVIVNEGNSRFFEPAPGRTWMLGASARQVF